MKIAVLTQVFLGSSGKYVDLGGDLIGGAEIYLHTLIEKVLEPMADTIVVYQKTGVSRRLSEKTFVSSYLQLGSSRLNDFDLVIINDLQHTILPANHQKLRAKKVAIHHGMAIPPVLTLDTIRTYHEFSDAFGFSARRLFYPTKLLVGERIVDLSLKLLKGSLLVINNPRQRRLAKVTLNRNSDMVDRVVSVDRDSLNHVDSSKRARWRVIYNFVDFDLFRPGISCPQPFSGITILVPRNLTDSRGVFIIPKMACLLRKSERHDFRFLIVGGGPLRPFLETEIRKLKLEKEVILLGHRDHFKDMPGLYANSDIILVPSFASEGTSLAVLEGMASKKPVVTTDVGGINDIGVSGEHKLSSLFNIKWIAENIGRLMEDENLMKNIGEAGYKYVCRNHNLNLWSKKWREVIENLWRN